MRIPLTKYGMPQVFVFPAVIVTLMVGYGLLAAGRMSPWVIVVVEGVLGSLLAFALAFFRDPEREIVAEDGALLSPADGVVYDIETVQEEDFIGGPAIRVGIFLSVFNTHINRAPCDVRVEGTRYRPGKFLNAMNRQAGQVNESNDLHLVRTAEPRDRLVVRQISGAIARRIVCAVDGGSELLGGQRFGMIKFGSRTELYVPARAEVKCVVKVGDKVKAGLTVLVRYES